MNPMIFDLYWQNRTGQHSPGHRRGNTNEPDDLCPEDRHAVLGIKRSARTYAMLVRKRAFLETFDLDTVRAKEAPLSCNSDHVSPYWYIRGVTPHRHMRRW
jgi:hypothetical protein